MECKNGCDRPYPRGCVGLPGCTCKCHYSVKCRAGECIHPINCTRRQECLSIVTIPVQTDTTVPLDTIIFKDKNNNEIGRIEGINMSDSGRQWGDGLEDSKRYEREEFNDGKGRKRHGSPLFYELLQKMAEAHDKKSHDYASNDNPFGNYHFAGLLSKLFDNPDDAGFIGRLGEKYYRLANLENNKKETAVKDESVEDTENDIAVITLLWIVDRRNRRNKK